MGRPPDPERVAAVWRAIVALRNREDEPRSIRDIVIAERTNLDLQLVQEVLQELARVDLVALGTRRRASGILAYYVKRE